MFIKRLMISTDENVIRDMEFKKGLNLIIDSTVENDRKQTGNNIGKTTVLKLVDFCLGGEKREIYTDQENKKQEYQKVKEFLVKENVVIKLVLVEDLENKHSKEIIIERNFKDKKDAMQKINNIKYTFSDFLEELKKIMFPNLKNDKPTFRQLISYNIRYKDNSINNTLKFLNRFTKDVEYESLYLHLLGFQFQNADKKQILTSELSKENTYKKRLENNQTKNSYEVALRVIENEIIFLNEKKSKFNINENFEADLEKLNKVRAEINKKSTIIGKLDIRKNIILEAKEEMKKRLSNIDIKELEFLYRELGNYLENVTKTFEELVDYHNKMIINKINFITKELPAIDKEIEKVKKELNEYLKIEKELAERVAKSDSFKEIEKIVSIINEKYNEKGRYEAIISKIDEVDENILRLETELNEIDNSLYSAEFEKKLKEKVNKFNSFFTKVSNALYGENYLLKFDKVLNRKTNKPIYKFSCFNMNTSSGKKQGEIICFDIAYILFATDEKIPHFKFLLNDKKELMHDNQLLEISKVVKKNNIQLVISILKDKLPSELLNDSNVVLELSQESKLFKI